MCGVPKIMKAVVVHGVGDYRLEEVPVPIPGRRELLVKVAAVGVCGSDGKCFKGAHKFWGDGKDIPRWIQPPVIPGHEFSGHVIALGPGASDHHGDVDVGDLVVAEQIVPCQECPYCVNGDYNMCIPHDIFGFHHVSQGAMAEYMIFPEKAKVHKVPSHVAPHHAAFVEPLACSLYAVEKARLRFTDVVVISGCGGIGAGIILGAKKKSPKVIVALDVVDWKLDVALKCGADFALNPTRCNVKSEIGKLTNNLGCDVYFDAAGAGESVGLGVAILAKLGRFVGVSVFPELVKADWSVIEDSKELTVMGSHLGKDMWPIAIQMLANNEVPTDQLITQKFELKDFMKAINLVIDAKESIKVMLLPHDVV